MGRRRAVHGALLAVALVAGVILGLLGMHAFDAHGTAHSGSVGAHAMATDGADAVAAQADAGAVAAQADAGAVRAHADAGGLAGSVHAESGPASNTGVTASASAHDSAALASAPAHDSAADSGCASCGAGGLAAACVLALLAGALLLLLPRSWTTPSALRVLLDGTPPLRGVLSLRAPSLHVLCISRR